MSNNLSVNITARIGDLTAKVAEARGQIATLQTSANRLGREMARAGGALRTELGGRLNEVSGLIAKNKAELRGLTGELGRVERGASDAGRELKSAANAASDIRGMAGGWRHIVSLFDEWRRGQRGAMSASATAFLRDTGYGERLLDVVKGIGPAGWAGAAAIGGIGAALADVITEAQRARREVQGVWNAALAGGRSPMQTVFQVRSLAEVIGRGGNVSREKAFPIAEAIAAIPDASERAKRSLAGIVDVWRQIQFGGDAKKTAEAIGKIFGSPGAMRATVLQNKLLVGPSLSSFESALHRGNLGAAEGELIQGLVGRYGREAQRQLRQQRQFEHGVVSYTYAPGIGLMPHRPPQFNPSNPGYRSLPPLHIPTEEEARASEIVAQFTALKGKAADLAALMREIAVLQKAVTDGAAANNAESQQALANMRRKAALLREEIAKQKERAAGVTTEHFRAPPGAASTIAKAVTGAFPGLKDFQVAAILGVLHGESGLSPLSTNATSGAFGIANWWGTRLAGLKGFAASRGGNYAGLSTQTAFLIHELQTNRSGALASLMATTNTPAAVRAFLTGFEGITPANARTATGGRYTFAQVMQQRLGAASGYLGTAAGIGAKQTSQFASLMEQMHRHAQELQRKDDEQFAAAEQVKLQLARGNAMAIQAIYQEMLDRLGAEYGTDSVQFMRVEKEKIAAAQDAAARMLRASEDAARKAYRAQEEAARRAQRAWMSVLRPVGNAVTQGVTEALFHPPMPIRYFTQTPRGAMAFRTVSTGQRIMGQMELGIGRSLVGGLMNRVTSGIETSLAKSLTASFKGGPFSFISSIFGGTKGVGQAANTSALAANTTAIMANTAAIGGAAVGSAVKTAGSAASALGTVGKVAGAASGGGGSWVGTALSIAALIPWAKGGAGAWGIPRSMMSTIVSSPTVFPMAAGSFGLMGEAGAEAVMPLARTDDGHLGVRMAGGAGGGRTIINAHFDGPSDGASIGRFFLRHSRDINRAFVDGWNSNQITWNGMP